MKENNEKSLSVKVKLIVTGMILLLLLIVDFICTKKKM